MKNLKIGTRLGTGFAVVVLLLLAVAAIGITKLARLDANTNIIVQDRVPKLNMARDIQDELGKIIRSASYAALATDKAQAKRELEQMALSRKTIVETLGKIETQLNTEKGKELFRKVNDTRANFVGASDRFTKLIEEDKKPEAIQTLQTQVRPAQEAYVASLDKFTAFLSELMKTANDEAHEVYNMARILMIAMTIIASLIAIAVAVFSTRSITQPLNEAVKIAETVASGDLTSNITVTSRDETGQLKQALKTMNERLLEIVARVRTGTDTIATASAQIAAGNQDLSSRTEEQASSLEETASSMEQMTSTVRQNGDNARQANQLAITAAEIASQGGSVVSQVVQTMGEINDSSKKMADIINVIDGIAFQTNILALNAAVEAARAGEQGRGFAVVATEVRNLAQRSANAAREIKQLIDDSVSRVATGSKLVDQAGETMKEIVTSIHRVTDIMSEITSATSEQVDGIEQINQAVTQMDQVTQQNAALVEEAAAAAEALQDQTHQLVQAVSVFRTGIVAPTGTAAANDTHRTASVKTSAPRLKGKPALQVSSRQPRLESTSSSDWDEY